MEIRILNEQHYAEDIARVHLESFSGFFLTFLGEGFLKQLYKGFIVHDRSSVIGALDDSGKLIGFIAYSENISDFYKYLIKSSLIPFAWYSLIACLKNPKITLRLLRALTYPKKTASQEPYIELSSIGVLPDTGIKGVGSALIEAMIQTIDFEKFGYIKLETDRLDNDKANHFYMKNGFVLDHSYMTPEGREMNEYRYSPNRRREH